MPMYLPAIFSEDPDQAILLDRLLSLYESFFSDVEERIEYLPQYLDPQAAPDDWLSWLAGFLALELDERWTSEKKRDLIQHAMDMYARRGTAPGLIEVLENLVGLMVHIEEPIQIASWWVLAEDENAPQPILDNARLGFTTRLVSAQVDGAVLGSSAQLDQSHLIRGEEFGTPLFESLAHRFSVEIYRGQVVNSPKVLELVKEIIEQEKPAHSSYHLCIIEPSMRVGFQARLGIDTLVAGPLSTPQIDSQGETGTGQVLGGEQSGRIGLQSQIGRDTRLTDSSVN